MDGLAGTGARRHRRHSGWRQGHTSRAPHRLRSKPAVPIGGKYRLIDIPISNCVHSQMNRIFILTQYNSVSLHRHVVRTYKFDPFSRGFVQILAAQQTPRGERWFQGTADAVRQNMHIISEMQGDDVLILSGDHMYRMDYREMLADHIASDADITISVLPCTEQEIAGFGAVRVDDSGRIVEFREKPGTPEAREGMAIGTSCGRNESCTPKALPGVDGDLPPSRKRCSRAVWPTSSSTSARTSSRALRTSTACRHTSSRATGGDIGTIGAFYETHMDLLRDNPPFTFDDESWPFYTLPRYLPGSKLHFTEFERTILSEGTYIIRCKVENSIIGVATRMREATVRDSLVMGTDAPVPNAAPGAPPVGIGEGTVIERAIVDKNARIGKNVDIADRGDRASEVDGPGWAIRDGIVVISKNAVIPDDTKI